MSRSRITSFYVFMLSLLGLSVFSQCPTALTPSIVTNAGGQVAIKPVFNNTTPTSGVITNWMNGAAGSYSASSASMVNTIYHYSVTAGNYSVCLKADSLNGGCPSVTGCVQITVPTAGTVCPTAITPSIVTNSGGIVVIKPVFDVTPAPGFITNWMNGAAGSYSTTATSMTNTISHYSVAAGNYSVCLKADSLPNACASVIGCIQITVAPTVSCPTALTPSIVTNSAGQVTIKPVFDITPALGVMTNWMNGAAGSYSANSNSMTNTITHNGVAAGNYSVCLKADSLNGNCPSVTGCIQITVASSGTACPTSITPNIVTNSGGQLTIQPVFDVTPSSGFITNWVSGAAGSYSTTTTNMINTISHYSVAAGNYSVCLKVDSLPNGCASIIGCVQVMVQPVCHAGFTYSTDANCTTHFVNTSTGASLTHQWRINNVFYNTTDVSVALPDGNYNVQLINNTMIGPSTFISCDTLIQNVSVICPSATTCSANAAFTVAADTTNPGNYYVYDNSTTSGTASYLWNFGDGNTSTQQYPVHQYAVPGQYILCLTITSTSGTVTCSHSHCDSSSVRRTAAGFLMSKVTMLPSTATSVKENNFAPSFKAYPNPVTESLTLDFESLEQVLTYTLSDAYGRILLEGNITESKTTLNTSLMPHGFYVLAVSTADGKGVKYAKIVK